LQCAYALLVESWVTVGVDVLTATVKVDESLGLTESDSPGMPGPEDNARALAELQAEMKGLTRR
jgi:hypothetical protein